MIIDNTIRKRWGPVTSHVGGSVDDELNQENDFSNLTGSALETGNRVRVTAQEWLHTWRMVD